MTVDSARTRLAPWAGWIGATVAVALNHQGLADSFYFDCALGNPANGIVVGLIALAIAWTGGAISWRSRHEGEGPPEFKTRYFVGVIGLLLAALYSIAIIFQVLAVLIVPACAR